MATVGKGFSIISRNSPGKMMLGSDEFSIWKGPLFRGKLAVKLQGFVALFGDAIHQNVLGKSVDCHGWSMVYHGINYEEYINVCIYIYIGGCPSNPRKYLIFMIRV